MFAGEYLDDSGLYYLRARFYDPDTASFLSVDPALTVSGSAYGYASGNPLQLVDPLGLFSVSGVGNWIQDHQVEIISGIAGAAVGAACLAVTAGAGSVACGALGGAVAGAVNYGMSTPVACWTAGGFFENAAIGAVFGGVTAGIGEIAAPFLKSLIVSVAGKLAPAAESALGRAIAALPRIKWPSASTAESAANAANSARSLPTSAEAADLLRAARPTGSALKSDVAHRAGDWVIDDVAQSGSVFDLVGGDGVSRTLVQMPGEVNGVAGRFEWIMEGQDLTHQLFVRSGTINGIPIKP